MSEEHQVDEVTGATGDAEPPQTIEEYRDQLAAETSYTLSQPLELRSKEGRLMSRKAEVALRGFRGRDIRETSHLKGEIELQHELIQRMTGLSAEQVDDLSAEDWGVLNDHATVRWLPFAGKALGLRRST